MNPDCENYAENAHKAWMRPGWSLLSVVAIASALLLMLAWSWETWCDPLIDFGTELYVPWQMTAGKVLYRDLAYYNGPFTQYVNAWLFMLMGVSIRTLVIGNFVVLLGLLVVLYQLMRRAFGLFSAGVGGMTFVFLFGFGQGVSTGNFNWLTPYRNDLTHGIALGLLAIALLDRYVRSGRVVYLATSGFISGLAFLTKAEPFLAAAAALGSIGLARWWVRRLSPGQTLRELTIFITALLAVPSIAFALLSIRMPTSVAAVGVAGSWPWVFDSRVTALPFYQHALGIDDVAGNLLTILWWTLGYAAVTAVGVALSFRLRSTRTGFHAIVFLIGATAMFVTSRVFLIDWNSIIRPLPICLMVMLIFAAVAITHRPAVSDRLILRLGLIVFSAMMLPKIALNVHVYHYGFAMAMPGMLMLVGAAGDDLPRWIRQRGGDGNLFRTVAAVCWGTAVVITLYVDHLAFSSKQTVMGTDGDRFFVDAAGVEVKQAVDLISRDTPPGSTLVVLPQGLMVNYLTRRVDPIRNLNFMPPEVLAEGEKNIIAAMTANPPDEILVNTSVIREHAFTLEGESPYGMKMFDWVRRNYVQARMQSSGPTYHFVLMVRRKGPTVGFFFQTAGFSTAASAGDGRNFSSAISS